MLKIVQRFITTLQFGRVHPERDGCYIGHYGPLWIIFNAALSIMRMSASAVASSTTP